MTAPTPVQEAAIVPLLAKRDVLVTAETGSGKTLAYLLPMVHDLVGDPGLLGAESPHGLILVPTRELAIQVNKQLEWLCAGTGIKSALLTGGQELRYQASLLRRNPEIIVATPGRLQEHLRRGTVIPDHIQCLVLDEADRMLDMGFREEVLAIAARIRGGHQTVLLSATLRHRGIAAIAAELLREPLDVTLSSPSTIGPDIALEMILADDGPHKLRLLAWLLGNRQYRRSLVFAKTRTGADSVCASLREQGYDTRVIHGEVPQDERRKIMADYREGRFRILVATDVAARGIDVGGLDLVINFDMAQSADEFVHRVGRTGRAGEQGVAVSLVAANDWTLSQKVQGALNASFDQVQVPGLAARFKGGRLAGGAGGSAASKPRSGQAGNQRLDGAGQGGGIARGGAKKGPGPSRKGRGRGRGKEEVPGGDSGMAPLRRPR